uniref:Piezo type mechanosensitive ion channel component 2 n=1 Tax=Serinus canaria TaxID=9135 RepID=A0A8C9N3Q6_SERCA
DALMYEEDLDDDDCGEAEFEETMKLKLLRRIAFLASKLREFIGNMIITTGKVVVTILLGSAGMMVPSLTSAVYFFVFLGLCTWWSCCQAFDPLIFSCLCVLMAIFSAGHLIGLYLYQLQFFQEVVPPKDFYARLFGVTSLTQTNCSSTWMIIKNQELHWYHHANPILLLVMYYTLATLIRLWLQEPIERVTSSSLPMTNDWETGQGRCSLEVQNFRKIKGNRQQVRGGTSNLCNWKSASVLFVNPSVDIFSSLSSFHQAWSITYHSWLTFVLLIWSCTLWMIRDRRKYAMISSPFMVFYGNLLLILQYIWSIELKNNELPQVSGFLKRKEPGELASKILFTITFWLLLRQHLTEQKALRLKEATLSEVKEEDEQDIMKVLGKLVMAMLIKYWIYVCGGMFFFVSFEGTIVMYKIIYMVLFLFLCDFQVHYEWWRKILKYFWMSVVVYTMLVLIFIYTYQFESFPGLWKNMTGLDERKLEDLGLKQFSVADLFTRIFIPTSFLLVCILHLHYFHDRFLQITDLKAVTKRWVHSYQIWSILFHRDLLVLSLQWFCLNIPADLRNKWHLVIDRLTVLFLKFLEYFHKMQVFVWWLLELHIIKIVSSYIIWVTVKEVSLLNFVFLIAWALALPYAQFRPLASSICTVWTCVIIVCKMLYQLTSIDPKDFSRNCTLPGENETKVNLEELKTSVLYSGPVDPSEWVGLRKSSPLLVYLRNNLLMLAILAFEVTIYRHQEYYRCRNNLTAPVTKTIFHDITRAHLDDGLVNCVKYFINYFFYKFGLETCFLLSVNVIGQRMDFYAMIHAFWLIAVLYRRRRKAIAEIWPKYCCFLTCIITFQYFLCIGIPPAPCKDYPWRSGNANFNSNIIKWLYFPDFIVRPNPVFLVYDFMLLLCASLQRQTFEDENKAAVRIMAGDNVEICMNLDAASFSQHNPVPDFIHCRSYLDMYKVIIFSYLFWFVLTIIFITGTTRISIFCMGYLVACFYFLLFGGDLLLKPIRSILRYWDWLIAYNVFVITMKNILSVGSCCLSSKSCWVIQAFSLACTVKGYHIPTSNVECKLPSGEAGIIWDSICFAFLLLQRRVFMSYYFLHVVADIKASQILASRSGNYYLFETDSEEEEEEDKKEEEEPRKKSAFQVLYGNLYLCSLIPCCFCSPLDNIIKRIFNILKFTWVLFLATLDSFTAWLNSISREHIDISTVLRIERCMLTREIKKEEEVEDYSLDSEGAAYTPDTDVPLYSTVDSNAEAPPSYSKAVSFEHLPFGSPDDSAGKSLMMVSPDDSRTDKLDRILPPLTHELTASELLLNKMFHDDELEESEKFYVGQPRVLLLIYALYNTLVARSEMVCYFVIILNHMISASMITLVLPILIFLWAMLSVPRPSKRFWMTAIVYTEVAIVIKYFFQFGFFPWNKHVDYTKDKPYHPPNIIGIEKKEGYVHYDLVQLLALFFHRSILKCHGLWDEDEKGDSSSNKEDTDDELSLTGGRRDSSASLKSVNLAASVESIHVHFPEQQTAIRRKSSSSISQLSHRSSFSSHRSKRGKYSFKNINHTTLSLYFLQCKLCAIKSHCGLCCFRTLQVYMPIRQFFYNLIHPDYSAVTDVYVLMFLADTVDFIIIVFGFWAFGKHSAAADITSSLSEDQVPEAFLVMVLIQFGTMVVDRALYLKKTVMGKVIFQVILVFGIHFWMFFILPGVTERKFSQNTVAQLWYFVKCVYFGLSAYQIRCGYPTRVLGNFLTKSYNYVNLFLFQGFRLVPFLTELRAVMDWVWTDTTLSLSSWICVEDIYAHIFILKCWRESEKRYPQPRGQKKKKVVKYGMGGMIIVLLICIVWFPLLFMSLIKSVAGITNKPLDVSITITLGGYQPIFTMSAQQNQLKSLDPNEFSDFLRSYRGNTPALQFLEGYAREDITRADLEGNSNSLWTISPPSRNKMIQGLKDFDADFTLVISWTIQRTLEEVYPYYIKAPSDSLAKPIKQLLKDCKWENITVSLVKNASEEWWVLNQLGKRQKTPQESLELFIFSDKVSPPSLGFLAGYGIMGLYASVVLVIGKFVREFFSGISHSIMFEELPNVDRILKLCTDIFLVRETGELELEEDLYAKLIFLYRSPETMIKWTREKTN